MRNDAARRIMVLGSGGREHALAWRLRRCPGVEEVLAIPGNPGMAADGITCLGGGLDDFEAVGKSALEHRVDLVVVGPEQPLVDGLVDYFRTSPQLASIAVFGPSRQAARLEGSKAFAKEFMSRYGIPTARFQTFGVGDEVAAAEFLRTLRPPYVLKADGLAAGKGVLILPTLDEAIDGVKTLLHGQFGKASQTIVIEEFLQGREVSVFAVCDGTDFRLLPPAKDYKRALDGDRGLNTGGMGSVSPVPYADADFLRQVREQVVAPTLRGMREEGTPFVGFLFLGLMRCPDGSPRVIEYNVRMGDPETQVVLPRVEGNFARLLLQAARGQLQDQVQETRETYVSVSLTSAGYPSQYETGRAIDLPELREDQLLFHAGSRLEASVLRTSGGRVLSAVGRGLSLEQARRAAMDLATAIRFDGKTHRNDIALDLSPQDLS